MAKKHRFLTRSTIFIKIGNYILWQIVKNHVIIGIPYHLEENRPEKAQKSDLLVIYRAGTKNKHVR
ncbi:MAG: hypothetical protein FWC50_04495 [Planctomycetaceae bacterium]|nr:hypothetical protein [Planctomycetaceae bacterium]